MPKQITIKAGDPWPNGLEAVLSAVCSTQELEAFRAQGASIRLTFKTPYPPVKGKKTVLLSEELLSKIRDSIADTPKLEGLLGELSAPELIELGKRYSISLPAKSKLVALRGQLFSALRSDLVWKEITGTNQSDLSQKGSS